MTNISGFLGQPGKHASLAFLYKKIYDNNKYFFGNYNRNLERVT